MLNKLISNAKDGYLMLGQKIGACRNAPSRSQAQTVLFLLGVSLLVAGLISGAYARPEGNIYYNDLRVSNSVNAVLTYLEGTFGALVMVSAGVGAILSSAFGQYRAALGLMVVAIGAFILRSFLSTFFNDASIRE